MKLNEATLGVTCTPSSDTGIGFPEAFTIGFLGSVLSIVTFVPATTDSTILEGIISPTFKLTNPSTTVKLSVSKPANPLTAVAVVPAVAKSILL